MAEICVKAVLAVADLDRRDVNLDLIKVCTQQCNLEGCRSLVDVMLPVRVAAEIAEHAYKAACCCSGGWRSGVYR